MACPRCNHTVRKAPLMQAATLVLRRTCPNCRRRWLVIVKPLGKVPGGVAHMVEWVNR